MDGYVRVQMPPNDPENTGLSEERHEKYDIISEFSTICTRKKIHELKEFRRIHKIFLNKYDIQFSELLEKKKPDENNWKTFREQKTEEILRRLYRKYYDDDNELLFFASALLEVEDLQTIKYKHFQEGHENFFNQTRNMDSAIIFALKYGSVRNEKILATIKFLVEECNVDTNIFDQEGKTAIDHVAELYKNIDKNHQNNLLPKILKDKRFDVLSKEIKKILQNEKIDFETKILRTRKFLDTKKSDQKIQTAMDYLDELCKNYQNDIRYLDEMAKILTYKEYYDILSEDTKNFLREKKISYRVKVIKTDKMDDKNKLFYLFYWISTKIFEDYCKKSISDKKTISNKTFDDFCKSEGKFEISKKMANSNNGENTLLQYAVRKNKLLIVQNLLKNGADPNGITDFEVRTPLELSIVYNNKRIFEELLKNSKTKVTPPQFNDIVAKFLATPRIPLKTEMFQLLLKWDKLEERLVHDVTGNTPLHFAVIYSNREAIESLLSRGASLLVKNKAGKAVIDIIDRADLQKFFDSRLDVKKKKSKVTDVFYKVQLKFYGSLVDQEKLDEFYVVSKLSKNKNFRDLLKHPLVYTFISLKWAKMKIYYWEMLLLQFILLLSLSTSVWLPPIPAFFIGLFNMAVKFAILPKMKEAPIHAILEISLILVHIFGLFIHQVCAFLFILMSICFLITTGYHPTLSKWSIMFQTVFKTFTLLLVFVSLVLFSFGFGFFMLFSSDGGKEDKFRNISTSLFKTYIMTAGELSLDDITFDTSGFSGYLILVIFTLYISLVIVNFWTAIAVTDVGNIAKEAEINSINNVVLFMQFVDHINIRDQIGYWQHCKNCLSSGLSQINSFFRKNYQKLVAFFKNFISKFSFSVLTQESVLFLIEKSGKMYYDREKCEVVSYIDSKDQLAQLDKENVTEIDEGCLNRIKIYMNKLKEEEEKEKDEVKEANKRKSRESKRSQKEDEGERVNQSRETGEEASDEVGNEVSG